MPKGLSEGTMNAISRLTYGWKILVILVAAVSVHERSVAGTLKLKQATGLESLHADDLRLAKPFSDHMVLQRDVNLPVWGTCKPGDKITVRLGNQEKKAIANDRGDWKVVFRPFPAGQNLVMNVESSGSGVLELKDILTGDVWLCSGQSNMEFALEQSAGGKEALINAHIPGIRLCRFAGIARTDDKEWDRKILVRVNHFEFFTGQWELCEPAASAPFSAIGYFFGKELAGKLNVPVGLVEIAVGGAPVESFIDQQSLAVTPNGRNLSFDWFNNELVMKWCRERAARNLGNGSAGGGLHPYMPSYLYQAGISQWAGFPVKGVIWYQGESNAHDAELYKELFPALVGSWRKAWKQPGMPFYFAQLSGIDRPDWPKFRNAQRMLAGKVPKAAMVVTFDLGDSLNVHPVRKKEVGERFAWLALRNLYGNAGSPVSPEIKRIKKEQDRIILVCSHCRSMKSADGAAPREIEIATGEGNFTAAKAIFSGNSIVLETLGIHPVAIRYGWNPYSRGNLVNESGLPMSTFLYSLK